MRHATAQLTTYNILNLTPQGRQEPFEERWNQAVAAECAALGSSL